MVKKNVMFMMIGIIFVMIIIFVLSQFGIVSDTISATITTILAIIFPIFSIFAKKPGSKE